MPPIEPPNIVVILNMEGLAATLSGDLGDSRDRTKVHQDVDLNDIDFDWVDQCTEPKLIRKAVKLLEPERTMYPQLYSAALNKFRQLDPKNAPREDVAVPMSDVQSAIDEIVEWKSTIDQTDELLSKASKTTEASRSEGSAHGTVKRSSAHVDQLLATLPIRGLDDPLSTQSATSNAGPDLIPIHLRDAAVREAVALREKTKGNEYFRAKEYSLAYDAYTRGITADPSRLELYTNRAAACLKLKDFAQAELDCSHVLKVDPNNIKAMLRRGAARQGLEYFWQSVADFESVLKIQPEHQEAITHLKKAKELATEKDPFRMRAGEIVSVKSTGAKVDELSKSNSSSDQSEGSLSGDIYVNSDGKRVRRVLKKVTKQILVPSETQKGKKIVERKKSVVQSRTIKVVRPKPKSIAPVLRSGMILEEMSEDEEVEETVNEEVEVIERVEVTDDEEEEELLTMKTVEEDVWEEQTASEDEKDLDCKADSDEEIKYDEEVKGNDLKSTQPAPATVKKPMKRLTILQDDDDSDSDSDEECSPSNNHETGSVSQPRRVLETERKVDPSQDQNVISSLSKIYLKKVRGNDFFKAAKLPEATTEYLEGISVWESLTSSPQGLLLDLPSRKVALEKVHENTSETVKQSVIALYTNLSLVLLQTFDKSVESQIQSNSIPVVMKQLLSDVIKYSTSALSNELDSANPKAFFRRALARRRIAQITIGQPVSSCLPSEAGISGVSYSKCRDALQMLRLAASDVTSAMKKDSSKLAKAELDFITSLIGVVQKAADDAQLTPSEAKTIGQGLDVSFLEDSHTSTKSRSSKSRVVKTKSAKATTTTSSLLSESISTRKAFDAAIVRYTSNPRTLGQQLMGIQADRLNKVIGTTKALTSEDVSAIVSSLLTVDMSAESNAEKALSIFEALLKTPEFNMAAMLVSDSVWDSAIRLITDLEERIKTSNGVSSSYRNMQRL